MKRELFKNISAQVLTDGEVIDRHGYLSAVLAVSVSEITGDPTNTTLSLKLEHSDTAEGTFEPVSDTMLNPEQASENQFPDMEVSGEEKASINIDLLGCKRYIKITPSLKHEGGESPAGSVTCALVLGDPNVSSV